MNDIPAIAWVIVGMSVLLIVLFRREALTRKVPFLVVLTASVVALIVGVVLEFSQNLATHPTRALFVPLFSLVWFRLLRHFFIQKIGREPKDTFDNWGSGLFWDRTFNIFFFVSSSWILIHFISPA